MKMKKYLSLLVLLTLTVSSVQSQVVERISAGHSAVIWRNASDDCTDPVIYELPTQSVIYYNDCLKKIRFWNTVTWDDFGAGIPGADGIQGIQGIPGVDGVDGIDGADGSGVTIRGSDTIANILLMSGIAGDMWISTSAGIDDNGTAVAIGDGIVSDGTIWITVGPIRGPTGATGATGPQGAQGIQGAQGLQGIQGVAGADGIDGTDATADGVITNIELIGTNLVIDGTGGAETIDVDLSSLQNGINTDDQTIALVGTVLNIEGGNSQDLSGVNTDNQNLVITNDVLSIENGAGSVDLGLLVPYNGATTNIDIGTNSIASTNFIDSDGTDILTNTTIDLNNNISGLIYYSRAVPSTALSLSVANLKQGGYALFYSNTSDEPTFTNATINGVSTWVADTTLLIVVYTHDGINAEYFFANGGTSSGTETDPIFIASDAFSTTNANGINTGNNAVNSLYSGLVTNATHSGDVVGSNALTIQVDAVDIPMLSASGTASSTTYLRGDNTWASIPPAGAEINDLTSAVTWANIPIANVPTGTTAATVALGNHLHTGVYVPYVGATVAVNLNSQDIDMTTGRIDIESGADKTSLYRYGLVVDGGAEFQTMNVIYNKLSYFGAAGAGSTVDLVFPEITGGNIIVDMPTASGKIALLSDITGGSTDYISNVQMVGNSIRFSEVGLAYNGDVSLSPLLVTSNITSDNALYRYTNDSDITRLALTSGPNSGDQTLSLVGTDLTISGGNTVTLPSGGAGGVTSIIAGAGIDIDQATGDVTISATGGGTVTSGNEFIQIALSDFVSELKEGTDLGYFRMPYGGTLIGAKASLLDAGTVTGVEIDILKEDLSILSTNLTTDATEKTSLTAVTPYVISDDFLPYDTQLTFDVLAVPTSAKGLIITLEIEKNVVINTEDWVYLSIPLSDLTTDLTTGADKGYFRMPYAATLLDATITLKEAGTTSGMNVDILKDNVSILSTALTTDATENTSVLATTPLVISTTLLENDSQITFSFNGVPTSAKGAIITLIYTKN